MLAPSLPRSQPQPGHLYDVAVIGAGLAGIELAWRLAEAGQDILLVSQALDHLGNLYQPTIEGLHFPPASIFARVVCLFPGTDGWMFHRHLKAAIESTTGIHLLQSTVTALLEDPSQVSLKTWEGPKLQAKQVVLAVGSFFRARLKVGDSVQQAGRLSEVAYDYLADDLAASGVKFIACEQAVTGAEDEVAYTVSFLTLAPKELSGTRIQRFKRVHAVGRCLAGESTYQTVLLEAAQLANYLIDCAAKAKR